MSEASSFHSPIELESDDELIVCGQPVTNDEVQIVPRPNNAFERIMQRTTLSRPSSAFEPSPLSWDAGIYSLQPGMTVELIDGSFLAIKSIQENGLLGDYNFVGHKLVRNRSLHGLLPRKTNELTLLRTYKPSTSQAHEDEEYLMTISLRDILRSRELIKTNKAFPALSFRTIEERYKDKTWISHYGRLVCRWKLSNLQKDSGELESLTIPESDVNRSQTLQRVKKSFREDNGRTPSVSLSNTLQSQYTFGDAFCGAGGASRAAYQAGFQVVFGFDHDLPAIQSYRRNFEGAECWYIAAHEFITIIPDDFQVDVLHISPPCQTFAPCHTRPGRNDETNEATFFAIRGLLRKTKPRIVTLEETFGLAIIGKHDEWLKALIHIFTCEGFSIRWKVFNFCEFGLPQPRKRLIIIASCPGEPLPRFPVPTHYKRGQTARRPDQRPFMTVNETIRTLPEDAPNHSPESLVRINRSPYSGDKPLRNTITCTAGTEYHPSGKRAFTLRELASLQGFPMSHLFDTSSGATQIRRQIGNAVPAIPFSGFFKAILQQLRETDEKENEIITIE